MTLVMITVPQLGRNYVCKFSAIVFGSDSELTYQRYLHALQYPRQWHDEYPCQHLLDCHIAMLCQSDYRLCK